MYYPVDDRHRWEPCYSPSPYSQRDWHDPPLPARGSPEFYPSLYDSSAPLGYAGAVYPPERALPCELPSEESFNPSFYDYADLAHTARGYGDAYQDPYRESWSPPTDNFWVNVPGQPFDAPAPHGVFGLSDSLYLGRLDVDGMSSFNASSGVYAPKLHSRAVDPLPSFQTSPPALPRAGPLAPAGPSTISPPVHLSPLWSLPVYRSIWNSLDEAKKAQLAGAPLLEEAGDAAAIKRLIDRGIQEKKSCRITRARTIFVELVVRYARNVQVWLEFCRLEMECGEYSNARVVLETASTQHPNNELLLQKRLRVEERLRSVENVIIIINELQFMDTQKSMKILVEGIGILAKLGYEKMAFEFSQNISTTSKYFTGNLYLEMMLGEQRSGSMKTLMKMIDNALVLFPKYGPLWFFCFNLTEHLRQLQWNKESMLELISVESMEQNAQLARDSLTVDILWKVFLLRVEYWYRACIFLRQFTFDNVRSLARPHAQPTRLTELVEAELYISHRVNRNMAYCVQTCPPNLLWKMYMTIGRYTCLLGYRQLGRKLLQRAFRLSPVKSRHAVILEYSKLEYCALHLPTSIGLLNYGITLFPSEWKLLLERIQQLVLKEQYSEALRLNIDALKKHIGAGRLWSSYIHIVHQ